MQHRISRRQRSPVDMSREFPFHSAGRHTDVRSDSSAFYMSLTWSFQVTLPPWEINRKTISEALWEFKTFKRLFGERQFAPNDEFIPAVSKRLWSELLHSRETLEIKHPPETPNPRQCYLWVKFNF